MINIIVISTTCRDSEEARLIASTVIEEKLAFCAQLGTEITSIYPWQGKIESSPEMPLLVKSSSDKVQQLIDRIKSLHSYDTPQLIVYAPAQVEGNYLEWAQDWLR